MKTLTKVKLINWHYFWNETIDIKPIAFLTGVNGSGKSTLIDALQVVLLGDTTGTFFNKAAMDKSSRTMKGYLRGELGDTVDGGFKYLRNGRFTSYVALEYYDDFYDVYFVMGIVFDSFDDGSEEHHFFCLEDKMPENEFIKDKIPMDYKTLLNFFNEKYKDKYTFFDSNRQYRDFLKRRFGGLKDKYFSLLKKATSFTPITDITTFITDYVCDPQANIELGTLQDNITQYKKLEVEAKNIEKRVNRLEEINQFNVAFLDKKEQKTIHEYILERCLLEQSYQKVKQFNQQIELNKARIKEIDDELEEFKHELDDLELKKTRLIQDRASNDTVRITQNLQNEKKEIQNKVDGINANIGNVKRTLNYYVEGFSKNSQKLLSDLSRFNQDYVDDEVYEEIQDITSSASKVKDACESFKENSINKIETMTKEDVNAFRDALMNFKNKVSSFAIAISRTMVKLDTEIRNLKEQSENIKFGAKAYDPRLVMIKERLEKRLAEKTGENVKVEIYADLIDIDDLSWRDAIEGFLAPHKFNLFVAPKYYAVAYDLLRKLLDETSFYATALVDEEKIIESEPPCMGGSLAEEINTVHEGARAYTNFLIGKLYKAKDPMDARLSGNGITKECDIYRNYSLSKLNPKLYKDSFIGRGNEERFAKEKANELRDTVELYNVYKRIREIIEDTNKLDVFTKSEIDSMFVFLKDISSLQGLYGTLEYIDSELQSNTSHLTESLDRRISDLESDIKSINESRERIILEKGNLQTENNQIKREKIVSEQEVIKTKEQNMQTHYNPILLEEKAVPLFKEEVKAAEENIFKVFEKFNVSYSKLVSEVNSVFSQLCRLRRDYVQDYHMSYDPEAEDNVVFDKELVEFRDVKLPEYKEKILDSYNKATKQFKDDFIFKLRGAIEDVEDQINNLNDALKQSAFGRDRYEFTVNPSQVYRRYYDMLKDPLVIDGGNDDTEFVNKYKDVMEDLFRQIVDVGDGEMSSRLSDNITKFTDYRSYLDFDLKVHNTDTGDTQRLSKMLRKKSGGETQTPFYISVLASFAQLYHTNEEGEFGNTTRLIIFDEAFSKMDRNRLTEAIKLLRKFNLQVILSTPSDKIPDISPIVDETLLVLHEKNKSFVKLFSKEE